MQNKSEKSNMTIIVSLAFLFFLCCFLGISLYNANEAVMEKRQSLENIKEKLGSSELQKLELDYQIKDLNNDIENLEDDIRDYQTNILRYEEESQLDKERMEKLQADIEEKERQLTEIYANGGSKDTKEFINDLTLEIERLRVREGELIDKNNLLVKQNEEIKQAFKNVSRELEFIKQERLKFLERKVELLNEEKQKLERIADYSSISAAVSEISVDSRTNEIRFKLIFDSNEIRLLRGLSPNYITIIPKIYNETRNLPFSITPPRGEINSFFTYKTAELFESILIRCRVDNLDLSKEYKNNPVNLQKGDKVTLSVTLTELDHKEIGNSIFYLK